MSNAYQGSFLICFRGEATELYLSGIPIAVIKGEEITYVYPKNADGTDGKVELSQIPNCPFKSVDELITTVEGTVGKLRRFGMPNAMMSHDYDWRRSCPTEGRK